MESTICMNERCGKTTSLDWKRGWGLKSGGFALLCCSCGLAYENSTYCLKFHLGESGWRDCKYCRKPIHCGCIASKYVHEYLDFGGVGCARCIRDLEMQLIRPIQNPSIGISNRLSALLSNTRPQSSVLENRVNSDILDRTEFKELLNLGKTIEQKEPINFLQRHNAGPSSSNLQINRDENLLTTGEPIHFLQPHNAGPSSSNLYARPSSTNLQINQEENLLTTGEPINFLQPHNTGPSLSNLQINPDENMLTATGQVSRDFFTLAPQSFRPSILSRPESSRRPTRGLKDMLESLTQQSLSFSLGSPLSTPNTALPFTDGAGTSNTALPFTDGADTSNTALPFTDGAGTSNTALPFIHWAGTSNTTLPLTDEAGTPNTALPFTDGAVEGTEKNKVPQFEESHKGRLNLQKPPKAGVSIRSGANKGTDSLTQVPRPPGEGRGRNQLLPRYWPRITDQELQQISGDLNSTIVPLFEKVLSASDAGRIGRLVLPKACAEAYFPAIDQSEGVPVRVQDIKGKEWTFQFRFWPNNNSRMYVLEGVTPCIQNMQLQAGDTVTFSKIEPSGKLVMGYRKAPINGDLQDPEDLSGETSFSYLNKNLPADSLSLPKNEENEGTRNEESLERPMLIPEKKRARNIGSKSKRLLINSDDAMKLTLSWEEAQQLLRPPLRRKPTIVMVDNHEVEEYDAPPVIGKKTMFTARESGKEDQWVQCDNCGKWRRLPVDVFLPPKWTCSDNIWDKKRSSCFAAYEIDPSKLESCLESTKEFKRRKITDPKAAKGKEQSRLGPLLRAAALNTKPGGSGAKPSGSGGRPRGSGGRPGGSGAKPSGSGPKPGDSGAKPSGSGAKSGDSGEQPSVPTPATTRHPRHRPGCSCIVCIQPPSGKGNHDRTCTCKVCSTVNRRFNTMMSRKKKRKSEQEAQITSKRARGAAPPIDVKIEMGDTLGPAQQPPSESEARVEASEPSRGHLDLDLNLNCQPNGEDDLMLSDSEGILPFGIHLRPSEPSIEPCLLSKAVTEIEGSSPIDRPGRGNIGDDR